MIRGTTPSHERLDDARAGDLVHPGRKRPDRAQGHCKPDY